MAMATRRRTRSAPGRPGSFPFFVLFLFPFSFAFFLPPSPFVFAALAAATGSTAATGPAPAAGPSRTVGAARNGYKILPAFTWDTLPVVGAVDRTPCLHGSLLQRATNNAA